MQGKGTTRSAHTEQGDLTRIPELEVERCRPLVQLKGNTVSLLMP